MAATSVKFAMPPPIRRALLRPSGSAVAHCNTVMSTIFTNAVIKPLAMEKGNLSHKKRAGKSIGYYFYINYNSCILQHLLLIRSSTIFSIVARL